MDSTREEQSKNIDLSPARWSHLTFTEAGAQRLAVTAAFLYRLLAEKHTLAEPICKEFIERMDYLNNYGGPVSETDGRRRFRVTLGCDFAPHSFSIVWERLNPTTGTYEYVCSGGLIWHGGDNDPLCVTLTPQFWGIHT